MGIDQNRLVVHDCVSIFADTIFRRNIVVGHAFLRKHFANSDVAPVVIRRPVLFDHVTVETSG